MRILAADIGTTHLKAGCLDLEGRLRRVAVREIPVLQDGSGRAEHDPEVLWDRFVDAVREAAGEEARVVRWIILSGYQLSLLPVDAAGRPLMGIMTLLDTRPRETFPGLLARMDVGAIYRRTGCPPLFQYPLAKLEWLRVRRPEVFRKARWFLGAKDYLLLRMFGRPVTDPSLATATQMMDVETLRWDPDILELVGLAEGHLPEVVPPETRLGSLRPEAAEALGLPREVEGIAGVYDGGAVGLGLGAATPGVGAMNLGTTAMIRLVADRPILDQSPRMRLQTYYLAGGRWFPGGAINNAGNVLSWLREAVLGLGYADQEALAEAVGQPTGVLFLPFLTGERYPGISHLASGVIFGLRAHHTRGHFARAAMEGVSFALRLILEALRDNHLIPLRLRAGGGGTRSSLWMRILASVLQIPVEVSEVSEPALMGSAALARVAIGAAPDLQVAVPETAAQVYEPVAEWVPIYERQFARFQALMEDLEAAFRRHQEAIAEGN
ncbi:MAG: gluconokinase [Thermoflexus sp.]|uniref:gluconokinase n=1 Tax=Thermoflexus sp. TaxID=1969742 RepID=UPI00260112E0|nr:gluconokinase [Thermoflexus sp.]MCS6964670.1 gluconokinase [Thermoflexus sp.]MDW8185175.1 gluconokinase [Anaerolineae bacterium]